MIKINDRVDLVSRLILKFSESMQKFTQLVEKQRQKLCKQVKSGLLSKCS
jgi:hypothetical protein